VVRRIHPLTVGWTVRFSEPGLARAIGRLARRVDRDPADGGLRVEGTTVVPVEPVPGLTLDQPAAVQAVGTAFQQPVARVVQLPVRSVAPGVDQT
jgi:hypothetical protein